MNLKHITLALFAAAALFAGCQQEEDLGTPRITVSPATLTFEQGEGSQDVNVIATRDWHINAKPEWAALSVESGKGSTKEQPVTISVNANAGNDRTGEIIFSIGLDKIALTINQKGSKGELKKGSGTLDDPYSIAGVLEYTQSLGSDVQSPSAVFFKGFVSKVETTFEASGDFGNGTFRVVDDIAEGGDSFYCYQTLYLGNRKWKKGDPEVKVGDEVIICGPVVNFKGNTPETVGRGASYVYSLNGVTEGGVVPPTPGKPSGTGTQADPYNVAAAVKAVSGLTWTSNTSYDKVGPYYVKGKVSAIDQDYTYNVSDGRTFGNARFSISDDGKSSGSEQFTLYNLNYLGDNKFKAGQTDIKVGDDVVIFAELMNYRGNTPENAGGYLYSLNGDTGQATPGDEVMGNVATTIAASDGSAVVINECQVAAISNQGLVVTDASGNVYLYFDAKAGETVPAVKIGDKVKVAATKDTYGGIPEFKKATVTVISAPGEITYPAPKDITSIAATYASSVTEYIQMTGTLTVSGNYFNVEIDGVNPDSKMGSISAPLESLGVASYDGKKITVTGYFSGLTGSNGKYINIVAVSIAPADPNAKYCSVDPASISVKADVTSASFAVKANAAWEATSDNADFTVSPSSGTGDATVTVSFGANTGEAARTAHINVKCADAGVDAVVTITQAKPSSGENLVVAYDFTAVDENLPQGSTEGKSDGTYTIDGYTLTFHAADKYYQAVNSGKYFLLIGKKESYIEFPAVEGKSLVKVEFLTGAKASENIIGDIATASGSRLNINNDKLKQGTNYTWELTGEVGAAYRFVVTNAYNAQFQTLTLTYE